MTTKFPKTIDYIKFNHNFYKDNIKRYHQTMQDRIAEDDFYFTDLLNNMKSANSNIVYFQRLLYVLDSGEYDIATDSMRFLSNLVYKSVEPAEDEAVNIHASEVFKHILEDLDLS